MTVSNVKSFKVTAEEGQDVSEEQKNLVRLHAQKYFSKNDLRVLSRNEANGVLSGDTVFILTVIHK